MIRREPASEADIASWIIATLIFFALLVAYGNGCAPAVDTAAKSAQHNLELSACRQKGLAFPGDKATKWDVYQHCADEADAKDRAR